MQGMERRLKPGITILDRIVFDNNGKEQLLRATGEVECHGDPHNPNDWWAIYKDEKGNEYYGR